MITNISIEFLAIAGIAAGFLLAALVAALLYRRRIKVLLRKLNRCNDDLEGTSRIMFQKSLELMETNTRINELLAMKNIFMTVFAHQLRTPFTAIKWSLQELAEELRDNEEARRHTVIILERVAIMGNLIENILRVSELTIYSVELRSEDKLAVYLETCAEAALPQFKQAGIEFKRAIDAPLPPVSLNRDFFIIALNNLLENARWYSKEGDTVWLRAYAKDRSVVVEVQDTGMGIREDEQARIFQKFYRSKRALRVHPDGSGLGLYIAQKIAALHHGKILMESTKGKGSTFRITLPEYPQSNKVDKDKGKVVL